ncbi:ABC transporter substrate-binding protein [Rhodospirillum rubrum]|uniref:Extracellular solute-binding protein, family 5 n=1 Tax=Rhodospirillum rubrum (strain ATCC 11170 / ATH 1.1.1 / DSM 467 / LMG 4362 / NCIMB 8255 / S1) TaxID=269796 RepID=Q2RT28_RHORT|nr:ABC transporter substrate-binding protein [Rhodospirillum rubrum]ABC22717.1 extracellular solute-binding protein, family 5 [Rhodospirillum rubrum ATCC 11170]AEO48437.1 extracellular solute-binding protein [Rhodospirillum rubrum F11]MBK5954316.1 ABC transporter substrate-binding protein [Rhodospirillum rubrum]QXG78710.1 ABC transporter substrate-binding protein [Rhodospirillum rubrum]HAQ00675.1 ABC transporter substrate-binding protein [Rhodospirillum rubrum]
MKQFLKASVFTLSIALTPFATVHAATPKDTLVMAWVFDDIVTLDPAEIYEVSGSEFMANVYDRLVTLDEKDPSKLRNVIAESWSVSEDGKTFTFKIRPNNTFFSGNPVTGEDVEFSVERYVLLDKNPAFIMNQFGLTKENVRDKVRLVDPMTVEIELDQAYAPSFFLNCVSYTTAVVDKKEVLSHEENGDFGNGWLKRNYAGSGPFFLKAWKPNESLVLEANPKYFDGAPTIKRVLAKNVVESATQQLLLEKGDVDVARNLTGDQLAAVRKNADITIDAETKATLWYMGLNVKNPILAKPEVRQAMKYLVDYKGMADSIFAGTGTIHQTFVPSRQLGALDETPFSFDLAKAKELLAKAGLPDGFSVTMDTTNKSETRNLADAIQSSMSKAGIKIELKVADNKTTLTRYRASEHDIYIGQWGSDYWDPHSNTDGYLNAPLAKRNQWEVPGLVDKVFAARDEKDPVKRAQMYKDLQSMALEESPYVIILQQVENAAVRKEVKGFVLGPTFDLNLYRHVTK